MIQTPTSFSSDKVSLSDLLKQIDEGKLQLPDFQRGWVWDDYHIVSLLASIGQTYPIGAVMTLETGNADVRFQTRPIEGVIRQLFSPAERLILDGQQRLTSLYQALWAKQAVKTRDLRGKSVERYYYLDIDKALSHEVDLEDAIVSLPSDRKQRNFRGEVIADYSTPALEYENEMLPLNAVLHAADLTNWQIHYLQAVPGELMVKRLQRWNQLNEMLLAPMLQYLVPIIDLKKQTSKAAICQVFEKVNTGGVPLTVFELLTATFAIDDFNLRNDWNRRTSTLAEYKLLQTVSSDYFLQAVCLFASYDRRSQAAQQQVDEERLPAVTCKRRDILKLQLADYQAWADQAQAGFIKAAQFLHTQYLFSPWDIPYQTQLVPLAVFLHLLGDAANTSGGQQKIRQWYWSGVLGELYGSAVESRFAKDVVDVPQWVVVPGSAEPATVREANFYPERLLSLRSRNSAAYKGVYALLMQQNPVDFRSGKAINAHTYFDEAIDIHHVFPKDWCKSKGILAKQYDSIINKTPLSAHTNRKIGGKAPSEYLAKLRDESGGVDEAQQKIVIDSHHINYELLRTDAFNAFMNERGHELISIISRAMNKTIGSVDLIAMGQQTATNDGLDD
ncbi:DUF262 domain-containing protein [Fibrella sp. USSR17]